MNRGLLLTLIVVIFLISTVGVIGDVWWTGTPDFVINETTSERYI